MKKSVYLLALVALLWGGCANVDPYAPEEPGGDEPGGDEPGGDEPGGDEPGESECKAGESQCDEHGQYMHCGESGKWIVEACDGECLDGKCIEKARNRCDNPLALKPGATAKGSTGDADDYGDKMPEGNTCQFFHTALSVIALTISETGYYGLTIDNPTGVEKTWGVIEASTCSPEHPYTGTCSVSSSKAPFEATQFGTTRLLNAGTYYLFVGRQMDDRQEVAANFDFTASAKKVDSSQNVCGYAGKITVLDSLQTKHEFTNESISDGANFMTGEGGNCSSALTGGKEKVYAFQMAQGGRISASLSFKNKDGVACKDVGLSDPKCPSRIGLYIKSCVSPSNLSARTTTKACESVTNSSGSVTISEVALDPGEYFLFVDSDDANKEFVYDLKITLTK